MSRKVCGGSLLFQVQRQAEDEEPQSGVDEECKPRIHGYRSERKLLSS
jgi:hypothetical protein